MQRLGRRPTAEGTGVGGRRPRPEGPRVPWGNDWQDGICNTARPASASPRRSGCFPASRQAELGIEDLAGNVWEWCASLYDPPTRTPDARVLRGGSWIGYQDCARSAARYGFHPVCRGDNIGFRVVCSSPIFEH